MQTSQDWQPTATLENLHLRSELLWNIRRFFHEAQFCEVQTPILSHDTVVDRHIDPLYLFGQQLGMPESLNSRLFLQSSPEFCMKRLMAAGAERIYQIGPVFRAGERGSFHNPEFTMLEWYRAGDSLDDAIDFLSGLMSTIRPAWNTDRVTYQQAFQKQVGICPLDCGANDLADAAKRCKLQVEADWSCDRDDWLNLLFAEVVQPQLGRHQPQIVTHFPASQSALAKICSQDSRVAERFELFVSGIELANGYCELLDAGELTERNRLVSQQRETDGKMALPQQSRLMVAMQHGLPPCAGCALGLDRLLMVLCRSGSIDDVLAFPIERA